MESWPAAPRRGRYRLAVVTAACLVALLSSAAAHAQTDSLEYAVKATYLYKFAPFVEWPATAFDSPSSPFNLCIVGYDPFRDTLDRAVKDQRIGQRPIVVRRLQAVSRDSGCHVMYVTGSDAQSASEALATVRGTPVLTVTDSASRARAIGVIHFVVQDNRVRFEIDNQAASDNHLAISSKLLSLAISVKPKA